MNKCRHADAYKAIHPPRCNNGTPCETCAAKWQAAQIGKSA